MLTDSILGRYNDDFTETENSENRKVTQIRTSRRKKMKRSLQKLRKKVQNLTTISSTNKSSIIPETREYESSGSATTETVISSSALKSKRVSFGEITVKHFPVIMADNPTCKFGPPLTLDWLPNEDDEIKTTVDNYEENLKSSSILIIAKQKGQKNPKLDDYMRLSVNDREKILKESGYTHSQIRKELEQINIERTHRIVAARRSDNDDKWAAIK